MASTAWSAPAVSDPATVFKIEYQRVRIGAGGVFLEPLRGLLKVFIQAQRGGVFDRRIIDLYARPVIAQHIGGHAMVFSPGMSTGN